MITLRDDRGLYEQSNNNNKNWSGYFSALNYKPFDSRLNFNQFHKTRLETHVNDYNYYYIHHFVFHMSWTKMCIFKKRSTIMMEKNKRRDLIVHFKTKP